MNRQTSERISHHYRLDIEHVEWKKKVMKLTTNRGEFALKETMLQDKDDERFIHMLRRLERIGYRNLVPILPTKYGEYTINLGNKVYYLMPWIEDELYKGRETKEEKIIAEMGVIHRLTAQKDTFNKELFEQSTKQLLKRWDMRRLEIEKFADEAERKIYPSPYELTFLTNTHHFIRSCEEAKEHIEEWHDACLESDKFRTVLCHGHLSRQHVHFTKEGKPVIFNFERASYDTPSRDLALFCRSAFHYSLWDDEQMMRWFAIYDYHLPLYDEELQLMFAYLSFPEPIHSSMKQYTGLHRTKSELDHVARLERRVLMMAKAHRLKNYLLKT